MNSPSKSTTIIYPGYLEWSIFWFRIWESGGGAHKYIITKCYAFTSTLHVNILFSQFWGPPKCKRVCLGGGGGGCRPSEFGFKSKSACSGSENFTIF